MLVRNEVEHNSHNVYYRSPIGAAEAGSKVRLGLQIKSRQQINQVLLRLWQDQQGEKLLPLTTKDPQEAEVRYYSLEVEQLDRCILHGETPHITPEFSLKNTRLMDQVLSDIGFW